MIFSILLQLSLLPLFFQTIHVKGVSKNSIKFQYHSVQSRYQNVKDTFSCLDKSHEIPYIHVNDDYCDCNDSSDEPGTSACSNGVFVCQNLGYKEKSVSSMDVGDEICNCCDGSDENPGVCPNICLYALIPNNSRKLAEEEKKEKMVIISRLTEAKRKIKEFVDNLPEFTRKIQDERIPKAMNDFNNFEKFRAELQLREKELESLINLERAQYLDTWKHHVQSEHSNELFKLIDINSDKLLDNEEVNQSKIVQLYNLIGFYELLEEGPISEKPFMKFWISEPYRPLIQQHHEEHEEYDHHVHEEEDHENRVQSEENDHENRVKNEDDEEDHRDEEDEQEEDEHDLLDHESEGDFDEVEYGEDGQKVQKSRKKGDNNIHKHFPHHIFPPRLENRNMFENLDRKYLLKLENPTNDKISSLSTTLLDVQTQIRNVTHDINLVQSELKRLNSFFELDFGPGKAYAMLFDICLTREIGNFNYTICPFYYGTQYSKTGRFNLGFWKQWSSDGSKYTKMIYDSGDECHKNNKRSYTIHLETPAACVDHIIPDLHEDL
ncbi:hypothetical protein MXB_2846 [Myxobolus squamalis]|nr:hypothetical protein MXB_2846 [Myxobolus squamalis]